MNNKSFAIAGAVLLFFALGGPWINDQPKSRYQSIASRARRV